MRTGPGFLRLPRARGRRGLPLGTPRRGREPGIFASGMEKGAKGRAHAGLPQGLRGLRHAPLRGGLPMRTLLRFGKNSRLRFVSHLDLQRFFQRALNRSGLPIAFSQGFNPHPIMSFASALAVGWTSEYEVLDFKLSAPMGRGRIEEAMRRCAAGGSSRARRAHGGRPLSRGDGARALRGLSHHAGGGERAPPFSPPQKRFAPPNMSWACAGRNPASARSTCGLWRSPSKRGTAACLRA